MTGKAAIAPAALGPASLLVTITPPTISAATRHSSSGSARRCATFGREDGCRDATSRGPASSAGIAAAAASTAGSPSRSTDMAA
jgi:hypothetical protein